MIEFTLPDEIKTRSDLGRLALEGSVSFGKPDGDIISAKWTLDGATVNVTYNLAVRTVSVPNNTAKIRTDLLQQEIDKLNYGPKWRTGVQALCKVAQAGVGVPMEQLSKDESDAILKLLLLNQRAIEFDTDGTARIKPLEKWVKYLKS